jgi:hypothetical protein
VFTGVLRDRYKETVHFADLDVDGRIMSKVISETRDKAMWTEF